MFGLGPMELVFVAIMSIGGIGVLGLVVAACIKILRK
jgi:hypothetical protein